MKNTIRLEELALLGLSIWLFSDLPYAWWWYPLLLLSPDISMIAYTLGNKTGAIVYNIFHHRGLAVLLLLSGFLLQNTALQFAGTLLFGHISIDRMLGYGLKYYKGFKFTHLGLIGDR